MTTGRINQVAFLGDTTTRTIPDADETRGDETGEEVVLIGHERLEMGGRRGGGPSAGIAFCIRKHERSRAGQFGGSPLDWNTGATARLAPRPRGGARRGEGQLHIRVPPKWVRSTGTPPRRKAPRGPWAESDGGSRPTVRCTSTEPADTDSPITAHATLRTRDNNPDERTTATRASGNTRARSCPHRWTRRGSQRDKQQAGREGSRRDKGQAAGGNDGDNHAGGCQPRLGRRRPGLGSGHITPRARGLQGEPTHGRAHGNLMPRPRQRRALLAIPKLGGPHQTRRPGLQLASTGSGHRRRDVAPSRWARWGCQHLGTRGILLRPHARSRG